MNYKLATTLFVIGSVLAPVIDRFPRLRVVFEHITTRDAAQFVRPALATCAPPHSRELAEAKRTRQGCVPRNHT